MGKNGFQIAIPKLLQPQSIVLTDQELCFCFARTMFLPGKNNVLAMQKRCFWQAKKYFSVG